VLALVVSSRRKAMATDDAQTTAWLDAVESPAGPLAFAVDAQGALLALQFLDGEYRRSIEEELAERGYQVTRDPARTAAAREQLREYAEGRRRAFDLPLVLPGTAWQRACWAALIGIPFGETRTYGQQAAALGRPRAARAVGRANATNPLPLVVPCHRLVGADGSLTGFEGGLHIKQALLAHEAAVAARDGGSVPGAHTD
jgi:O-6-methylguanine DNA methyltransferase